MTRIVFETEIEGDEWAEPIIRIPRDIFEVNNHFLEEDDNTSWRIRVTIEKI